MKFLRIVIPVSLCLLASCSDEPVPHFTVSMERTNGDTLITYTLSDTAIEITERAPDYEGSWNNSFGTVLLNEKNALRKIAGMKPKSFDCNEQHALVVDRITFDTDSLSTRIDPNVNHPKEIDEVVRIFNLYVPENRKLEFEDMQPAIEPNGKMQL